MRNKQRYLARIQLATYDESKVLVLSNFRGSQTEPYQCEVEIYSEGFGYKGTFYFDNYVHFVSALEQMSRNLTGTAELRENYKEQMIKLELTNLGHVLVSGTIEQYGDHAQELSFGFKTDQTCLMQFSKELRMVVE